MNIEGPGPRTVWPIVLFEQDGHGEPVLSEAELADFYEDTYWDEISAAYDRAGHRIDVELLPDPRRAPKGAMYIPDLVRFTVNDDADVAGFAMLARNSLKRAYRRGFLRVRRATPAEAAGLDATSDAEVVELYLKASIPARHEGRSNG